MDLKQIVWLASFPKSGNTWLRCLLDGYFVGEVDINDTVTSHGDAYDGFYNVDNESANRFDPMIQQLIRPAALVKMVLRHLKQSRAHPMFVKTHYANGQLNSVETLPKELTKAVIYIVRDPRDIVPSYAAHMGMTYEQAIESMATPTLVLGSDKRRQMTSLVTSWNKNVRSYTTVDEHNALLVKYEDMKQAPDKALSGILKHIGIEPDEKQVKRAVKLAELSRLKAQEAEEGFGEQSAHNKEFFGKKHKPLSVRHRRQVERLFGREMKMLGYL